MRKKVILVCEDCLARNYQVQIQPQSTSRLVLKKYCSTCKKHTIHKQTK
jgi:ribosomal protein L33, bacterial type